MDTYTKRVRDSILPLSIGDTLPKAFDEWRFTGNTHDHGEPCETCQLCGKEDLRYHFEIGNSVTRHTLQVGSHCILKFEMAVYGDDGKRLSAEDARKKLEQLTELMRLESCLAALERVAQAEPHDILTGALQYYRKNKKLTPKLAFVVFWRLNENNIDYSPSFFHITIKKKQYLEDLAKMPTQRVHVFWSALTTSQRKKAIELGHRPPAEIYG